MAKLLSTANCNQNEEGRMNIMEIENEINEKIYPKKEIKNEYDLKDNEIPDIEKLTGSRVICNIGYGGFSTVKLIFNQGQNSYYALKVINLKNKKFKKKPMSKNREFIHQEILVNFNLKHPHIVKLHGYYQYKEYVLLIMEYLNNRDLKSFMKKFHTSYPHGKLSELLAGYFALQILKAMKYLRMRNIVHRDIKPENVMLNSDYMAKLGDFSLSRKIDPNTSFVTSRSGTLPYLSPECVKNTVEIKPFDCQKIDIFAFGVVIYFFLFNKHPYNYKNTLTITEYTKTLDKTTLDFEGNTITSCCKDFLQKILHKNIHKRISFDEIMKHNWITSLKDKVEDIVSKYQSDPDKMISQLNNTRLTDDFFICKGDSFENNVDKLKKIESLKEKDNLSGKTQATASNNFSQKKRKRMTDDICQQVMTGKKRIQIDDCE